MSRQIQLRRGTSTQHNTFTGAQGEVTFSTDECTLRVHDGKKVGGYTLARKSEIPLTGNLATINMDNLSTAGRTMIATLPMPSTKFKDFPTNAASGTVFGAPSSGYLYVQGVSTNAVAALALFVNNQYAVHMPAAYDSSTVRAFIPVTGGASFFLDYVNVNVNLFRFFYTIG